MPSAPNLDFSNHYFDWYQVTFDKSVDIEIFLSNSISFWEMSSLVQTKSRVNHYNRAFNLERGSVTIFHVCFDTTLDAGFHLISTGGISDDVAKWLQNNFMGFYQVSRADVRIDVVGKDAWNYLYDKSSLFCLNNKIKTHCVGDWLTGIKGRTFYMGATSSVTQIRLYEKGKKEGANPDWIRFEIQVRPAKSKNKSMAASYKALEFWQSSKWTSVLIADVLSLPSLEVKPLFAVWKASDDQRALNSMLLQYGNLLERVASNFPNGWDDLGSALYELRMLLKQNKGQIGGFGSNPYDLDNCA